MHEDSDQDIDKTKPVKLNIESRPPEKSQFEKIYSTVIKVVYLFACFRIKLRNSRFCFPLKIQPLGSKTRRQWDVE